MGVATGHFEDQGLIAGCAVDDGGKAKAGMGVDSSDPRVHAGLGEMTQVQDVWPDGSREEFGAFAGDQIVTLKRGSGNPVNAVPAIVGARPVSKPVNRR